MPEDTIFISHANPEDNDFTKWLAFQLTQAGYKVWSDVTGLLGGEDFWKEAEATIRNSTVKFLYVLSRVSNVKDGPLQELHIAKSVSKIKQIPDFIIPLHIDNLPYSEVNVQLARLNAVEFGSGWASGLSQLLDKLHKASIARSADSSPSYVSQWWSQHVDSSRLLVPSAHIHVSNILPVCELPTIIYRHTFQGYDKLIDSKLECLTFPAYRHRKAIVSFVDRDTLESELDSRLQISQSRQYSIPDFTQFGHAKLEPDVWELRLSLVRLLGLSWRVYLRRRRFPSYTLSQGVTSFYFTDGLVNRNKLTVSYGGREKTWRAIVGTKTIGSHSSRSRKRFWHFAVSLTPRVYPELSFVARPHVLFSDNGASVWENKDAMHKARRSQCKNWWNQHWRDRLLASVFWLSNGSGSIALLDRSDLRLLIGAEPLTFQSPVDYSGDVVPDEYTESFEDDDVEAPDESSEGAISG